MYQPGHSRTKCCLAMFFCIIGPMFLFMGIIFVAIIGADGGSQGINIAGGLMIFVSSIFIIIAIALCIVMRKGSQSTSTTLNNGLVMSPQPLVSGAAPPGPIGGFHVMQQQHQASAYPSAPPMGSNTADAPPSYTEATGK